MKNPLIVVLAFALGTIAVAFDEPGTLKARWPIKTSLPTSAALRKHAHPNLGTLIQLGAPPSYVRKDTRDTRIAGEAGNNLADGQMVEVDGFVHMVARDPDGDYHIQITESADKITPCFIVEIPKPEAAFVGDAALRPKFDAALRDPQRTSSR